MAMFVQGLLRRLMHGVLVLAASGLGAAAQAQDSNQSLLQYGPQGVLLDGATVGGVSDLSATYYNPGALALLSNPRFAASLISATWDQLRIRDESGGLDLEANPVSVHPNLVAGSIDHTGRMALAWSFLMRQQLDYELATSALDLDVEDGDGVEATYGRYRQRIREYWGGPTWSYRLGERTSVGVSAFGAYRLQRFRRAGVLDAIGPTGGSTATFVLEQEYDHARVLPKLGLAWRKAPFDLGLTMTMPGLRVWSKGRVRSLLSQSGAPVPVLGGEDAEGLDADYHSPWSLGGGAAWRGQRARIYASAEWYLGVDSAPILMVPPARVFGSEVTFPVSLIGGRKEALWFAAGLEHEVSRETLICASFSRDPSSGTQGADALSRIDLTSVGAGVLFPFRRARLGMNLRLAFGEGPVTLPAEIPGIGPGAAPTASIRRLSVSFGTANRP
jgi:hypothetical protein